MQKGLNFNTIESQEKYFKVYDQSLKLLQVPFTETYVSTSFGDSHIICCGDKNKPALVLLHAASCGSTMWYLNIPTWSQEYCVYAIDLIGESSKSILTKKMKTPYDNAKWLDETLHGLELDKIYLCGLSIGGWTAMNYAGYFPQRILKLILLSPVQSFAKMYPTYFIRIMKMGFHPTRENIENYIGWGNAKETSLPDSIIEQFTISVMNMNSNVSFPKWIKKEHFHKINMPVLVLFGENEFAFSINKAIKRAHLLIEKLEIEVIKEASHLLSVSNSLCINQRVINFIEDNKE
ncbi:MAG: alpha/beta hydrolase [Coprobacillus sp.]